MHGVGPTDIFVDANVWYSRTLRDWLGMLYVEPEHPPFVVHWSEDVLAELLANLRKKHPDWSGGRISALRDQIAATFEIGRVHDYSIDSSYRGNDPHDAHVHAAAISCGADILVTSNAKDFVWDEMAGSYEVMHPDDFLLLVDDSAPHLVSRVTRRMCAYWVERTGEADLPANLKRANCPKFAERVRNHLQQM